MAAETKWKRPWDDESQGGLDYSRTPLRKASPSSNASGRYTPSQYEHGGINLEERRLPPHSNPNSMATLPSQILSPSPHRLVGFFAGSEEGLHYHRENPLSYTNGHKRQRIEHSQFAGEASVHAQTGLGEGSTYGYPFQGTPYPSPNVHADAVAVATTDLYSIGLGKSAERPETRERSMSAKTSAAAPGEGDLLRRPSQVSEPLYQPSSSEARNPGQRGQCATCATLHGVVPCIVSGICILEKELSVVLASKTPDHPISRVREVFPVLSMPLLIEAIIQESDDQREAQDIDQKGLCQSLDWVLGKVNCSVRMVKALITSNISLQAQATHASPHNGLRIRRRSSGPEAVRSEEQYSIAGVGQLQRSPPHSDDGSKIPEISSNRPTLQDRRNSTREFSHHSIPSPRSTVSLSNTILTRPQSPMQAPPSRLLPSPSSMNFSTSSNILPSMSPSLLLPKSPHTAHLQELQHQLSTKSLAHQILQGEHDKLLAAFSRSQIRCATLDKKSQVSDSEINDLAENNLRLQEQINAYEIQVEELQLSRDEAWKQSVASGAQYTRIMAMSSQLQVQGVAELRRWREDREAWEREKRSLRARVECAEGGRDSRPRECTAMASTDLTPALNHEKFLLAQKQQSGLTAEIVDNPPDDIHDSDSIRSLRGEIQRLQERNHEAENALSKLREEGVHIEVIIGKLESVHRRIQESATYQTNPSAQASSAGFDVDADAALRDQLDRP